MARITKKRALAVAGTLAVAGLALSACSGGGSEAESGDTLKLWHYEGADSAMAKRLQVQTGAACLVLERRTWQAGAFVTEARITYPGDRHQLVGRFSPVA